jgi:hypothetical protein
MKSHTERERIARAISTFCRSLQTGDNWAKRRYELAVHDANTLGLQPPNWDEYQQAQCRYRDELRAFVDRWLDTGREADGREEPPLRNISLVDRTELDFYLTNYFTAGLGPGGEIQPGFTTLPPYGGFRRPLGHYNLPAQQAKTDAIQSFLQFLLSDWRFNFAKCRRCGEYFGGDRKLHPAYKRGVHCPQCRNRVTAIVSTRASKQAFRNHWLPLAANAWNRWKPKYGERIAFVTSEVNKRLDDKKIARNSVTRRRSEIESLAAERSKEKKGR